MVRFRAQDRRLQNEVQRFQKIFRSSRMPVKEWNISFCRKHGSLGICLTGQIVHVLKLNHPMTQLFAVRHHGVPITRRGSGFRHFTFYDSTVVCSSYHFSNEFFWRVYRTCRHFRNFVLSIPVLGQYFVDDVIRHCEFFLLAHLLYITGQTDGPGVVVFHPESITITISKF